MMIKKVETT